MEGPGPQEDLGGNGWTT